MRFLAVAALALTAAGTSLTPAAAQPAMPDLTRAYPGESYTQYYYGRPYYGRPYYGGRYYYRRDNGAAVAAGVAGLAAGALIAGAIANQAATPPPPPATVDPQLASYCARRFRSFDPVTGTYLARSGQRLVCTY
ncbi:MAG TPA: BA14K family protein [Microvirga sp.]|jgi:hypothetical protein